VEAVPEMAGAILALSLSLTTIVSAGERWRTPDGRIYYGNNPPAGSAEDGSVGGTRVHTEEPRSDSDEHGAEPGGPTSNKYG
jgi:hypothetical protein